MSNNLALTQLATNQASPEVPINDMSGEVDAALTEALDIDLTGADGNITLAQYQEHMFFRGINATAAVRAITFPLCKRSLVLFENDSANTKTINLVLGTTSIATSPGRLYAVRTDGTVNGLVARDIGGTFEPNDLHIFLPGAMTNNQICYRMKATRAFTLPQNLAGSYAAASIAATASTTVTLKKNGTSIGTIVWAIAGTNATFTFAADVSFAVGDLLEIDGPATADATLANISLDLFGKR